MTSIPPFHLAIPVDNLEKARDFYGTTLGLKEGRSSDHWVDFNFFGHQLVIHYAPVQHQNEFKNEIDNKSIPVPHFGLVLIWEDWQHLVTQLKQKKIIFVIEPYIRFEGEVGEQATMFFYDPCGNALEFKSFKNPSQLFAK